jgi:hypothetical protein
MASSCSTAGACCMAGAAYSFAARKQGDGRQAAAGAGVDSGCTQGPCPQGAARRWWQPVQPCVCVCACVFSKCQNDVEISETLHCRFPTWLHTGSSFILCGLPDRKDLLQVGAQLLSEQGLVFTQIGAQLPSPHGLVYTLT